MSGNIIIRYDERSMVVMDPDRNWVFSADPLGRITWVYTPETHYRRSRFDQWYIVKRDQWTYLEPADPKRIEHSVETWSPVWRRAAEQAGSEEGLVRALDNWGFRFLEFHRRDGERFRSIYRNIPILPPDAYQALYIQISEGCPWNRCRFCSFYRDQHYHVLSRTELEHHLQSVRDYWDRALPSRRGLFLGDANAIAVPTEVLLERLERIRVALPHRSFREFQAFTDFFTSRRRTEIDFLRLHELGLTRLCVGVESGNTELLEEIEKPVRTEDIVHTLRAARAGGLEMSLIFIIGLGGRRYRDVHFEDSLHTLELLPLRRPDRIYLSPLSLAPDSAYGESAERNGWQALRDEEIALEINRWKAAIARVHPQVPTSLYNIRHFAY